MGPLGSGSRVVGESRVCVVVVVEGGNVLDDVKREVELFGRGNVRDAYV